MKLLSPEEEFYSHELNYPEFPHPLQKVKDSGIRLLKEALGYPFKIQKEHIIKDPELWYCRKVQRIFLKNFKFLEREIYDDDNFIKVSLEFMGKKDLFLSSLGTDIIMKKELNPRDSSLPNVYDWKSQIETIKKSRRDELYEGYSYSEQRRLEINDDLSNAQFKVESALGINQNY